MYKKINFSLILSLFFFLSCVPQTERPEAPSRVLLHKPNSTPNEVANPEFLVQGVKSGFKVSLHPYPNCTGYLGQAMASSENVIVKVNALKDGAYQIFAKQTNKDGVSSNCSKSFANYQFNDPNPPPPPNPVSGALKVLGNKIVDQKGDPVQLRGVNIADPQHIDKQQSKWKRTSMDIVKDAVENYNVNVLRIPVVPESEGYPEFGALTMTGGLQKYFDTYLNPIVQYLTSKKVYAIVDLHYVSDYDDKWPRVKEFWSFMAPKYKDNPYVIYELFNEPILPDDWNTWKNIIAQPGVDLIRSFAPENIIIVGGPYWSSHMWGAATNPVSGKNLAYTIHAYSNQSPTMWKQWYEPVMAKFPMVVTEWGFEEGGTEGGTQTGYGIPFLDWMEDNGLSWTAWCFDNQWGPRMFDANWNIKTGNGGMGDFVRDALLKNQ